MIRVGITGGIGSGKSTVCELFVRLGVPVYDSDSRARELVNGVSGDGSERGGGTGGGKLRRAITELLGEEAYRAGVLDSTFVADKVFGDRMLLASLNAIVHPAVAEDFEAWALAYNDSAAYVVLESAILFESGFNRFTDKIIAVSAPENVRLERVLRRGAANEAGHPASREEVMQRMANQVSDDRRAARADYTIDNSGTLSELAARVEELDKLLKP